MSANNTGSGNQGRSMRIEILVAAPPTSKCKQIITALKAMLEKHPGRLKLDIYYAGMQLTIKPTRGYQVEGKLKKVPSVFVNGLCVANGELPDFNELEKVVESELAKGPDCWET